MQNIHYSPMFNAAWCDLNNEGDILKLLDICYNLKFKCQKQTSFQSKTKQMK